MPLFEKKVEKVEVRKLSEIVLDMLSTNVPEADILITLKQSGLNDAEARQVLDGAKSEYEKFATGKLTAAVDQMWEGKKQELRDYLGSVSEAAKKDLLLQLDLKILEQRRYVDEKIGTEKAEIDALKSEMFNVKVDTAAKLQRVDEELEGFKMRRHIRMLLAICAIAVGLSMAGYFAISIRDIAVAGVTQANTLNLAIYAALVIVGAVFVKLGVNIYLAKRKEFKQVGEVISQSK